MPQQPLGIDKFKANFAGGSRGSLFKVSFPKWPEIVSDSNKRLEFHCKASSLPASTVGEIPVPYRGRDLKIFGKRTFEDWQITVINDQDMDVRASFELWSHKMTEHGVFYNDYGPAPYNKGQFAGYMVNADIEQLDMQHKTVRTYNMVGCWPKSISSITVSADEDSIEEFTVDLTYQYWQVITNKSQIKDKDTDSFL